MINPAKTQQFILLFLAYYLDNVWGPFDTNKTRHSIFSTCYTSVSCNKKFYKHENQMNQQWEETIFLETVKSYEISIISDTSSRMSIKEHAILNVISSTKFEYVRSQ